MKSTKAETAKRVEQVYRVILLGGEFHDIREYADSEDKEAGKEPWNVSDTSLRRYQQAAHKLFQERVERDREKIFARHLLARRALYARAVESGDWRAALAIARDEAELQGLYPSKNKEPQAAPADATVTLEVMLRSPEARRILEEAQRWEPPLLTVRAPGPVEEKQA